MVRRRLYDDAREGPLADAVAYHDARRAQGKAEEDARIARIWGKWYDVAPGAPGATTADGVLATYVRAKAYDARVRSYKDDFLVYGSESNPSVFAAKRADYEAAVAAGTGDAFLAANPGLDKALIYDYTFGGSEASKARAAELATAITAGRTNVITMLKERHSIDAGRAAQLIGKMDAAIAGVDATAANPYTAMFSAAAGSLIGEGNDSRGKPFADFHAQVMREARLAQEQGMLERTREHARLLMSNHMSGISPYFYFGGVQVSITPEKLKDRAALFIAAANERGALRGNPLTDANATFGNTGARSTVEAQTALLQIVTEASLLTTTMRSMTRQTAWGVIGGGSEAITQAGTAISAFWEKAKEMKWELTEANWKKFTDGAGDAWKSISFQDIMKSGAASIGMHEMSGRMSDLYQALLKDGQGGINPVISGFDLSPTQLERLKAIQIPNPAGGTMSLYDYIRAEVGRTYKRNSGEDMPASREIMVGELIAFMDNRIRSQQFLTDYTGTLPPGNRAAKYNLSTHLDGVWGSLVQGEPNFGLDPDMMKKRGKGEILLPGVAAAPARHPRRADGPRLGIDHVDTAAVVGLPGVTLAADDQQLDAATLRALEQAKLAAARDGRGAPSA